MRGTRGLCRLPGSGEGGKRASGGETEEEDHVHRRRDEKKAEWSASIYVTGAKVFNIAQKIEKTMLMFVNVDRESVVVQGT